MDTGTVFTLVIGIACALLIGFVIGCVYSDAHWKPVVDEYKNAIATYKKILQR